MIKRGPQGETVYVNQFYTQRPGATGTKHIYAGTSRIASKLVRQDTPNSNPSGNTPFEKDLYFFHPDHIGSSNYVTDLNGKLYEHLEYFPFGEAWVEENSNQQRTPYLFTAKELDEETGLYYFGARYYDPRTSVWQSADPILVKYLPSGNRERDQSLPGMGGVFNSPVLNLYAYGHLNPIRLFDPDGRDVAVPVAFRVSNARDISQHRDPQNPYVIVRYEVYDYSTVESFTAARDAGTLSRPIGSFELTFESRMAGTRGSIMGNTEKWAEMQNVQQQYGRQTKHAISITDIGQGQADTYTVAGSGERRSAIRAHSGGPYGSLGCATSCDPRYAGPAGRKAFENELTTQMPSLGSETERSFISVPGQNYQPFDLSPRVDTPPPWWEPLLLIP